MSAVLGVEGLTVTFRTRAAGGTVTAVSDVTFSVEQGETIGLVGGSGAGKSTIARAVAGLVTPQRGRVRLDGVDLTRLSRAGRRQARRAVHLVFQDPYASLPPTLTVAGVVAEPLVIHGCGGGAPARHALVVEALAAVHLTPVERYLGRYPHQLSGGERQRVAFARAIVAQPRLILADEPTQMLDASMRAGIVDLLGELCSTRGVAVVHITHDLALAQRSCDRLVVLSAGRVVEEGPTERVLATPAHPYTVALVDGARRLHATRPAGA